MFSVADILDPPECQSSNFDELQLDATIAAAYRSALDIIDPHDRTAVTACFAGGYGKSIIRSGSYLQSGDSLRRFSPTEIARLLGFSDELTFPHSVATRRRWKMLVNSVSIPVVRSILARMAQPDSTQ